jgi:hypothetical protein
MSKSAAREEAVARMRADGKAPRFGDLMTNESASASNPRRFGFFVRTVRIPRGRMNAGVWFRMTDGRGDFWSSDPSACRVVSGGGFSVVQIGILLAASSGAGVKFAMPEVGGRRPDALAKAKFERERDDLVRRGYLRAAGGDVVLDPSGAAALEAMTRVSAGAIASRLIAKASELMTPDPDGDRAEGGPR